MCRWRRCAIRTRPLGRGQWARTAGGGGTASAETVRQALAGKRLLLVLDNLEQVAEAAPFVGDLVSASPELRVLATSRLPLRLRAEHEYLVLPLGLPPRHAASPEEILCFEAVRLFVERAQTVKPGSSSPRKPPWPWPRSYGAWTGCRWPSSWRQHGYASFPRPRSWRGSRSGCRC